MQVSMNPTNGYAKTNVNPNFKAQVVPKLRTALLKEAQAKGPEVVAKLNEKLTQVASWGPAKAVIQKIQNSLTSKASSIAMNFEGFPAFFDKRFGISERFSLLDQFFALKEKDLLKTGKIIEDKIDSLGNEVSSKYSNNSLIREILTGDSKFDANKGGYALMMIQPKELVEFARGSDDFLLEKYGLEGLYKY